MHDNDIREILKSHRIDNYSFDPKNQISHNNYKLLLVLMKNKKAALYENNFYNLEYSTDWDKIIGDNNGRNNDFNTDKNLSPKNIHKHTSELYDLQLEIFYEHNIVIAIIVAFLLIFIFCFKYTRLFE